MLRKTIAIIAVLLAALPSLWAQSNAITAQGNNLTDKLQWLRAFAQSGGSYILEVTANESLGSGTWFTYGGKIITITLRGVGANRTISRTSYGAYESVIFEVSGGVTLVLDNNITLRGGGIELKDGGKLIMNNGSAITGAKTGVWINGDFTMNGGRISGNTDNRSMSAAGVQLQSGTFTMNGGEISGNTNTDNGSFGGNAGGVNILEGTFTMNNGIISGNTVAEGAGGVFIRRGSFTMNGGTISGNRGTRGGGVCVFAVGTFTMKGGTISGNTASNAGGGVDVGNGFNDGGIFAKTGGTITGYASDQRNGNVVKDASGVIRNFRGHAVYALGPKIREGTAGPGDNLSYNSSKQPTTTSGAWDNAASAPAPAQPAAPDGFVRVEGGTFRMGSDSGYKDERPAHTVTITGFYMRKYEVTQKEWTAIMGSNPSGFKGDNLPVEQVSWFDAVEYCNKLSQKEGLTPAYNISGRTPATGYPITAATVTWNRNATGYRLPTEAEWEYAARGGNGSPGNYTYSGSNNADEVAWYDGNSGKRTRNVGTKEPNGLGLYDMSGNVREWCWDWHETYQSGAQTDPTGASSGSGRMYRGGDYHNSDVYARSVSRIFSNDNPNKWNMSTGFRIVRNL